MNEATRLASAISQGDAQASSHLLPLVYAELRLLAAAWLASEKPGHLLQPTALVHEAYLRLVGSAAPQRWDGRGHFFSACAQAMRRILIEQARQRRSLKRGNARQQVSLDEIEPGSPERSIDLLALDEALDALALEDPQKARLVELRYFAGMSLEEAAEHLELSRATASRAWAYARAWLFNRLKDSPES